MPRFFWRCNFSWQLLSLTAVFLGMPMPALAHCPLCTLGAGAAAVTARFLGAGTATIGIFLGAFSVALGSWMAAVIKRQFIPFQLEALAVLSFIGTILPLKPLFREDIPVPIFWLGDYGSILNRTYIFDIFLVSAIIGGLMMLFSKTISGWVSSLLKGPRIPYQGLAITFLSLIISATILEVVL